MDWFEKLTGFRETSYEQTRGQLEIHGASLRSRVNGASYGVGMLELASLATLRDRVKAAPGPSGRSTTRVVTGDVRKMHHARENAGALFQVASQFNLLEMVGPSVTPEDGVTRYHGDHTQGPACAIAAGAATIYRNYFAPVDGKSGQTALRQLDGLAELGATLSAAIKRPVGEFWTMRNGYAMGKQAGLDAIGDYLGTLPTDEIDMLRGKLHIGIHSDVEVTDAEGANRPHVSQAFCSALPVAYCHPIPSATWQPLAKLVLEAAYEATVWAAVLNERRGESNILFLTLLGGGAFGNADSWIESAIRRALALARNSGLDVRLVSFGSPSRGMLAIAEDFG